MTSTKSNPYPGAHRRKSGRWTSTIKDGPNNRRIWLGTFRTPEEASAVYLAKKKELDAAKKNELDASKRGMVSSSHKKRNKPIEFFLEEIKNPVYNEEIVGDYENWVKTTLEGDMVMVASHRKRNKPINVFGEEIETQLKKNPVYCKEIVGDYENRVKTQMGIRAKESKRESLNESPSSVLPDVYDELATCKSVFCEEIDPQIRKPVYSKELAAASKNLRKTQLGIGGANESGSESVTESFSSVLGKSAEAVNEEGNNSAGSLIGEVLPSSSCKDDDFLLRVGPVNIDNHGSTESARKPSESYAPTQIPPMILLSMKKILHQNVKNMTSTKSNPYPGAHRRKSGRWTSAIMDGPNNRRIWLGTFRTPEEASAVYLAKKKELDAAKKKELDASKRGMVSSSHKKRNKPIEFFLEEIKNPVYNEEIVGAYENWVNTTLGGGMVMVASHRKSNKPINVFGEEIETQLKKNPVHCKEIVGDYENRVKTQMGIRAKESKRESLNESPSSVLPDVYDELATCKSVFCEEIDPQIRKPVYSEELAAASKNLWKTQLGIGGAIESGSESVTESFSSVLGKSAEAVNEEGNNSAGSLIGEVLPSSSCKDDDFLLRVGPVSIDNHGSILGEFSWLDDLRICNEDRN